MPASGLFPSRPVSRSLHGGWRDSYASIPTVYMFSFLPELAFVLCDICASFISFLGPASRDQSCDRAPQRVAAGPICRPCHSCSLHPLSRSDSLSARHWTALAMSSTIHLDVLSGHLGHLSPDQERAFASLKDILHNAHLYSPSTDTAPASHDDPTVL